MSSQTIYLVTGANRGIGLGLTKQLLSRPNTTVIAGVRDVLSTNAALTSLPTAAQSKVVVVKLDSTSQTDAAEAVKELESKHGISKVDVLIANAGIANYYGLAATTPLKEFTEHFTINVVGVVSLFQAFLSLLQKSSKPKFVTLSTGAGSIGLIPNLPLPATAYGTSKVALNFVTRKIHDENKELIAFAISPGWVQTDMGNTGAKSVGMEQAPTTIEECITGLLNRIDNATRETGVANFLSADGNDMPY